MMTWLLLYSHTDSLMKSCFLSQKTSSALRFTKNLTNANINRWALNTVFQALSSFMYLQIIYQLAEHLKEQGANLLRIWAPWRCFPPKPLIKEVKHCLLHRQVQTLQAVGAQCGKYWVLPEDCSRWLTWRIHNLLQTQALNESRGGQDLVWYEPKSPGTSYSRETGCFVVCRLTVSQNWPRCFTFETVTWHRHSDKPMAQNAISY